MFKPKQGEKYYYFNSKDLTCPGMELHIVNYRIWSNRYIDKDYYNFGNCFETEEKALEAHATVKAALTSVPDFIPITWKEIDTKQPSHIPRTCFHATPCKSSPCNPTTLNI